MSIANPEWPGLLFGCRGRIPASAGLDQHTMTPELVGFCRRHRRWARLCPIEKRSADQYIKTSIEHPEESKVKNPFAKAMIILACASLLGCNTWAGLGKDFQKVGRKMENAGERRR